MASPLPGRPGARCTLLHPGEQCMRWTAVSDLPVFLQLCNEPEELPVHWIQWVFPSWTKNYKKIPLVSTAKDISLSLLGRTAWLQDSPSSWKPVIIQTKFSQSSTCDTWGQIILCCEGCPVHRRMFSTISGLYPLDASSTPFQGVTTKNVPRHYQICPEDKFWSRSLTTYYSVWFQKGVNSATPRNYRHSKWLLHKKLSWIPQSNWNLVTADTFLPHVHD